MAQTYRSFVILVFLALFCSGQAQASPSVNKVLRSVYAGVALHDIVYTTACVSRGICRELNFTFTPVMRRGGIEGAMMMKGAEHGAIILASEHYDEEHPTAVRNVLIGLIAAQVAVNVHNWKQLHQ